jgi:hypothetical protein
VLHRSRCTCVFGRRLHRSLLPHTIQVTVSVYSSVEIPARSQALVWHLHPLSRGLARRAWGSRIQSASESRRTRRVRGRLRARRCWCCRSPRDGGVSSREEPRERRREGRGVCDIEWVMGRERQRVRALDLALPPGRQRPGCGLRQEIDAKGLRPSEARPRAEDAGPGASFSVPLSA